MLKKGLLVLIIVVFAAGGAFAQNNFASMAKNTVTVDVGPTIVGFAFGSAVKMLGQDGLSSSGFGIGAQYERQLSRKLSAAARFAYLMTNAQLEYEDSISAGSGKLKTDINLASFSIEGHVRFYPIGEILFLDGMVGYANLKGDIGGSLKLQGGGYSQTNNIDFSASRNYIKLGAKVGGRFSFGKNGGFTFEPALGYSFGIGLGDPIKDQLNAKINGEAVDVDDVLNIVENYVFIGGPRLSLAFGYRF